MTVDYYFSIYFNRCTSDRYQVPIICIMIPLTVPNTWISDRITTFLNKDIGVSIFRIVFSQRYWNGMAYIVYGPKFLHCKFRLNGVTNVRYRRRSIIGTEYWLLTIDYWVMVCFRDTVFEFPLSRMVAFNKCEGICSCRSLKKEWWTEK